MKTISRILVGSMLVCSCGIASAQQPVRNLKADVERNRYVSLHWDAPLIEEDAEAEVIPGDFSLWKTIKSVPGSSYEKIVQFGDDFYGNSPLRSKEYYWFRLDKNLNKTDSVLIHGENSYGGMASTFSRMVGNDIYAVRQARVFRDTVFKYDLKTPGTITPAFQLKNGIGVRGLAYVPDLNGGKGGFAEASSKSVSFYDMDCNDIDFSLKLADIDSPSEGSLNIFGVAYYNHRYFILGNKGTKSGRLYVPYIWEFDDKGEYTGLCKDMTDLMNPLTTTLQDLYTVTDSATGNVYLVTQIQETDADSNEYVCALYYFEIGVANTFSGYEVSRNGKVITGEGFRQTSFADDLTAPGEYTYDVVVKYSGADSEKQSVKVSIEEYGECKTPTNLKAAIFNRKNVQLKWDATDMDGKRIALYHIMRDGNEVGTSASTMWTDTDLEPGTYSYSIIAEYENSGISNASEEKDITLSGTMEMHEPRNLSAVSYINDNGETTVNLNWDEPSFGPDAEIYTSHMKAEGTVSLNELCMGVNYDKSLNYLENYAFDEVSFVAGCAGRYRLVIFENDQLARDIKLDSLYVKFNELNTVKLAEPLPIVKDNSYLVAILTKADAECAAQGLTCLTSDNAYSSSKMNVSSRYVLFDNNKPSVMHFSNMSNSTGNFNISTHLIPLINTGISEEDSIFKGYDIYRNGEKIGTTSNDRTFTDSKIADGDYTYSVASIWENGSLMHSEPVAKNVTALYGAPDALAVALEDNEIALNWKAPLNGAPTARRYDSGTNAGKVGLNDGSTFSVAALYDTEDLKSFGGMSITSVEFFPAEHAVFTVFVKEDDETVFSKRIEKVNVTPGKPMIVNIPEPLAIAPDKDLRVGYEVSDYGYAKRPAGYDDTESLDGHGNQISFDGTTWASASEQGITNNWNIAFTVQYFNNNEARPVRAKRLWSDNRNYGSSATVKDIAAENTEAKKATSLNSNKFIGYNVYRDDKKLTAAEIQELAYNDTEDFSGNAEYYVSAVYSESPEMPSKKVSIARSGINAVNAEASAYYDSLRRTIVFNGNYDNFLLYSLTGITVLSGRGQAEASTDGLESGCYMLTVKRGPKTDVLKIYVR